MRASVAAILGGALLLGSAGALAAEAAAEGDEEEATEARADTELAEVRVTGSRIVRRELQSNSPMVSVEREKLEDNTYISLEQALNELPQFMVGGAGLGAFGTQTGVGTLGGMEQLDGGAGTGTMFDNARLPDTGGRIGTYTPGAANVNLRGLGSNRSLTLIDGHRGQPTNATGTVDLNTIPSAAIANIEVITGGASAVYGADALAGVTNIIMRDDFEGISVRLRGGLYEVGDGGEFQASTLMGTSLADGKGNAMIGIEYSKRNTSYYRNRSWFREAMESPYSSFANASFQPYSYYSASGQGAPSQTAVNGVFSDRDCTNASGATVNCISATNPSGGGFYFNSDGTLFTRSSACYLPTATTTACATAPAGATPGSTLYYGPQGYTGDVSGNSRLNQQEIACAWVANQPNTVYPDRSCNPTLSATDWDRWLGGPREGYNLFGRATYQISDKVQAFSTVNFATSTTQTRREASPASGSFSAQIPYSSDPAAIYLPSIAQTTVTRDPDGPGGNPPFVVAVAGQTLPEFRSVELGGTNSRGTNCGLNGCTMAEAFPVSPELAQLLNSRVAGTRGGTANAATNPWAGLSSCISYQRNPNAGAPTAPSGAPYTYQVDPNTGQPVYTCGPNASWAYNSRFGFIPARGTINTQRTWSIAGGLRGDLPFSDWTWEVYTSQGQGQTNTEFQGFVSMYNYRLLMSQPNFGMGYTASPGGTAKTITCTSGLSPWSGQPISADCIEAIASNQMDRSSTDQRVHEVSVQGRLFEAPAGEVRSAMGVAYRKNQYAYTPDSLRERDYVNDTSAGQFGIGSIDADISVKEAYGELLVPLLRDLPLIRSLELELGARWSEYSTGRNVPTWKALLSWQPVTWMRARGGYNRAERAPNIAELYTRDSANSSGGLGSDPCRRPTDTTVNAVLAGTSTTPLVTLNHPANPYQAQLQALCAAQIAAAGGNGASEYDLDPNNFGQGATFTNGIAIVKGNPDLKSEKGQTWTVGLVLSSPFSHPLLSRISSTVDWYEARIDDPIEIVAAGVLGWACFNAYGDNPNYELDDPNGYCSQFARDPVVGNVLYTNTPYLNRGKLVMRGMDVSANWSAALADMGLASAPGRLSIGINANFLFDQIQAVSAGGTTRDYAGIGGAADFRANTNVGYSWGASRVSVSWSYRSGSCIATFGALGCDTSVSRYPVTNTFTLTGGTRLGPVNASLSVSNPLNKKPRVATYDWDNPTRGFGTFNPFDDLTGRRWSLNLGVDF